MASGSCYGQMLHHPEVLDREILMEILRNRCIPITEIKDLDKQEMVALFYKHVAPLPQRMHQLRRGKREPPKTTERPHVNTIPGSKRYSEEQTSGIKVKIPKSDLEHVLINNGPSNKQDTTLSNSNLKQPRTNQEVKTKPVKLKRKFVNLDLSASPEKSSPETSNDNSQQKTWEKHRDPEPEVSLDSTSNSHSTDEELKETKKKFKKIIISWP